MANTRGRVPADEVAAILEVGRAAGCDTLDTAVAYGDAEQVLGDVGVSGWRIVTKLPAVPNEESDVAGWVYRTVRSSLSRLRVPALHAVLLHRPQQLLDARGAAIAEGLSRVRDDGLTTRIGVSVTTAPEISEYADRLPLSLVQVPFNLFDRRLLQENRLAGLAADGIEVHVRSIFLQGLLLMPDARRPPAFDRWADYLRQFDAWLQAHEVTAVEACVREALSHAAIERVVVGVDSLAQWREVAAASIGPPPPRLSAFDHPDPELISPLAWLTYPKETMQPRGSI